MTNEERPNWVEARANCTLEDTFEQVVAAIKHDIDCFNALHHHKRGQYTFKHDRVVGDDKVFFGIDSDAGKHDGPIVTVRVQCGNIQVLRDHKFLFEIERRWNEQTLTCDLLIEGESFLCGRSASGPSATCCSCRTDRRDSKSPAGIPA